ncbi:MAG: hypothetical protein DRP56_07155 [Planctomycetota bacterium]|nr:MAG: hypothetical protein DRP56_07155 [Planctomycetota bacterium]
MIGWTRWGDHPEHLAAANRQPIFFVTFASLCVLVQFTVYCDISLQSSIKVFSKFLLARGLRKPLTILGVMRSQVQVLSPRFL